MKHFVYQPAPATLVCNCTNQHLLLPGETCDLCMGMVVDAQSLDALPERKQAEDLFDESYFEALESFYEDITYAA